MAKFCIYCGKSLEEGQTCHCKKEKNSAIMSKNIELLKEISRNLFLKPVDTIKKHSKEENFQFGLILLLAHMVLAGVFVYCLLKEGLGMSFHSYSIFSIQIPFFKTFFSTILFTGIGFLVTIGTLYLFIEIIFKEKTNIKKITTMVGICSMISTVSLALSSIMIFVFPKLTIFLLLVASLFYLIYLCQGILEITNLDKNKLAYVFIPTIVITMFVVIYLLPKMLN